MRHGRSIGATPLGARRSDDASEICLVYVKRIEQEDP